MSRKQLLPAKQLESAKTLASSFQTSEVTVDTADNIGLWIYASSVTDNTGTFGVDVRPYRDQNTYGDWVALSLSPTSTLANTDQNFFISLNQLPNCQVRVNFTAAGGTPDGVCDVWIAGTGA